MEGQRKAGERGFNFASLNFDVEPAPKEEPKKKGDYAFATSLMQKVAAGSPTPEIKKGAELKWDGTKFVLHVDGKLAPTKEPIEPKTPPTPEAPTSRDVEPPTKNPNNIPQKGTIMGGASSLTMEQARTILNRGGLEDKGYDKPFSSTQLPATSASDYFSETDVSYSRDLPENMFNDVDLKLASNAFDAGSGVEFGKTLPQFPASGQIEFLQTNGAPLTVNSGAFKVTETNETAQEPEINKIPPRPSGARQAEKWDQQYGRMRQPVEREKSELEKGYKPDKARRDAFLDDDLNSMEALRAVEAQQDIVFTGNQYYLKNPNAGKEEEPDFFYSGKEHRDIIMRGGDAAQELKDKYVKGIVNSTKKADDEEDNK